MTTVDELCTQVETRLEIDEDEGEVGHVPLRPLKLKKPKKLIWKDPMFVLRLLQAQEERLDEMGKFASPWAPPLIEPEDDFKLVLIQWSTEYDRVMRTHRSKRVGQEKLAAYYIEQDRRRLMTMAVWRKETNRGVSYWTDEKKAAAAYDPETAMLWGKWLAWVPPPPKCGSEPDPPIEPKPTPVPKPKEQGTGKGKGKGGKHGKGKGKGKGKRDGKGKGKGK